MVRRATACVQRGPGGERASGGGSVPIGGRIPSNHKWFRNLAISRIVVETLESLKTAFPPPSVDIEEVRRKYHAAAQAAAGDGSRVSIPLPSRRSSPP